VNLTKLLSGTKHCGYTKILFICMKFSMFLSFFKGLLFKKDTSGLLTRKVNSWIKRDVVENGKLQCYHDFQF
jgi:hypothetical protein